MLFPRLNKLHFDWRLTHYFSTVSTGVISATLISSSDFPQTNNFVLIKMSTPILMPALLNETYSKTVTPTIILPF